MKRVTEFDVKDKIFVLCMKGVEVETGKRLTEVLIESGIACDKIAVWVGPGHIQAFVKGQPNCMLIDAENKSLVKYLADGFRGKLIRFYYGDDIIGTEIGAAAKNVMGIAAGMLDGGGYTTLKGPLMARGAREVARLIKAMGGNELSAYGLCHLGDYETTLFSEYSNNRNFGEKYVKGEKFDKLAEGVMTAKAMLTLGEKYKVELPITSAVCSIIYENKEPMSVFLKLFSRSTRKEF
jgi:glycerol-3-phosphate dehydrogenase (NAD(P)+)